MAWTQAARDAALETRRANAAAKKQTQQRPAGQPKPVTGRRPAQMKGRPNTNAGNRAAFALRNKMQHDAGKDQRIAAYNARQAAAHQTGTHLATLGKLLLGATLGAGGAILRGVQAGKRGGSRY